MLPRHMKTHTPRHTTSKKTSGTQCKTHQTKDQLDTLKNISSNASKTPLSNYSQSHSPIIQMAWKRRYRQTFVEWLLEKMLIQPNIKHAYLNSKPNKIYQPRPKQVSFGNEAYLSHTSPMCNSTGAKTWLHVLLKCEQWHVHVLITKTHNKAICTYKSFLYQTKYPYNTHSWMQ